MICLIIFSSNKKNDDNVDQINNNDNIDIFECVTL